MNIFADRFLALINNISVGWHLLGVAIIIGLLWIVPDSHQSANFVFTERFNESGFFGGSTSNFGFWFFVLPIGFLLTMYTRDRLRRLRPHRRGDPGRRDRRRPGRLAVGLLLGDHRLDPAALVPVRGHQRQRDRRRRRLLDVHLHLGARPVGGEAGDPDRRRSVSCSAARPGLTSASRTWYAFSRDRAIPGWSMFRRVNRDRVPFNAVIAVSLFSLIIAIPALFGKNNVPFAFFALTGICTVGLYVAYIIPVYLRLRAGDSFKPGPWTLGPKYKWVNTIAILFVILVVFALDLPYTPAGLPWNDGFDATLVNYMPLAILIPLIFGVWYLVSAKNKYQGPVSTLEEDVVTRD